MKVLCIDGGGVKGIIPLRILQEVEKRTTKRISQLFDIISGTSTGGLIALGLTKPSTKNKPTPFAKDIVKIYQNQSEEIFPQPSIFRKIKTGFGLWGAKYDRTNLDKILEEIFQDTLLNQTICPVFVPIYSLTNNKPFIASTFFAKNNKINNFYLKDIAGATSAAPTYFDPKVFKSPNDTVTYQGVDGGIYANNPEVIGVTGVYLIHPKFDLKNIMLVSLGTGEATQDNQKNSNNGIVGWLKDKDLIGDMMDAESVIAETAVSAVLKDGNHFRLQPNLPDKLDKMDNSSKDNIDALLDLTESFIQQNNDLLDNLCKTLTLELL